MRTEAYISSDRLYRYWLLRVWEPSRPLLGIIGTNPSTADERDDDHTIRKEIGFAKRWYYGGLLKLNVGAYRETDPRKWRRAVDPFGPENSAAHLAGYIKKFGAGLVVAAWGRDGASFAGRCDSIASEIPDLFCLGRNNDGSPKHPARLPYSTPLEKWRKA